MNVLSLFDGMSCGRIALERAGIPVTNYFASEIDKSAMYIADCNWGKSIKQIGDVTQVYTKNLPKIDLLIAGSPCQGFSNEGDKSNFNHKGSKLFFEFVRILKECNPKYFLLENVWMKKEWADIITKELGVEPIMIDSQLVSAQKRRRYYWTNIPNIQQPNNIAIFLKDVLIDVRHRFFNEIPIENVDLKGLLIDVRGFSLLIKEATKQGHCTVSPGMCFDASFPNSKTRRGRLMADKSNCITATKQIWYQYVRPGFLREITVNEIERLQGVDENYTIMQPLNQRFKMLGNGWQIDTITHIFKNIPL